MNLTTPWSSGSCKKKRSLNDIREGLMNDLSPFKIVTFSYEGVPFLFKENLHAPRAMRLFKYKNIATGNTVFTSDIQSYKNIQVYLKEFAAKDYEFKKRIKFDSPRITRKEEIFHPGARITDDFNSSITWPFHELCPKEWGGFFSLRCTIPFEELEESFDEIKPKLHHILLIYHLELMSGYRSDFNPYLKLDVFNKNALTILKLLASGSSSKEIAGITELSERGIEYHIKQMCIKLGAKNRTHLVHLANKVELI